MNQVNDERSRHVVATANRLRMVQVGFADEAAPARRQYLSEELKQALAKVLPTERAAFLEELRSNFPTWDQQVELGNQQAAASQTDLAELRDPSFLVTRLIELSAHLTVDQRTVLAHRLAEAGLSSGGGDWPLEADRAFKQKMQIPEDKRVDAARLMDLAGMLTDFVNSIQQVAWNTWRTLAPRSTLRNPGRFSLTAAKFAGNDQNVPRGQIAQELDLLRGLIASVIASVGQAGKQFARKHLGTFAPASIQQAAQSEGNPPLVGSRWDTYYWRKYDELAKPLDEAAIDAEIMQAIGTYAESLMKGLTR